MADLSVNMEEASIGQACLQDQGLSGSPEGAPGQAATRGEIGQRAGAQEQGETNGDEARAGGTPASSGVDERRGSRVVFTKDQAQHKSVQCSN